MARFLGALRDAVLSVRCSKKRLVGVNPASLNNLENYSLKI